MKVHEERESAAGRRRNEVAEHASQASGEGEGTIESWLSLFEGLLHLPLKEKESTTQEIGSHLRERVRDLLLEGYNETNAIHAATRELGDAAELAKKFESVARGRSRRLIMQFAIFGVGIGALVTAGVFTFQQEGAGAPVATSIYQSQASLAPPEEALEATVSLSLDSTLRDLLDTVESDTDLDLIIDWGSLQEVGVDPESPLGLSGERIPLVRALELVQLKTGALDWRFREGGLLEIGISEHFDEADTTLVAYDVDDLLLRLREQYNLDVETVQVSLRDLLINFVESEQWIDMGGEKGQLQIVGGTLFIEATATMHEKIQWILGELPRDGNLVSSIARSDEASETLKVRLMEVERRLAEFPHISPDDRLVAEGDSAIQQLLGQLIALKVDRRRRGQTESSDARAITELEGLIASVEAEVSERILERVNLNLQAERQRLLTQIAVLTADQVGSALAAPESEQSRIGHLWYDPPRTCTTGGGRRDLSILRSR